jgi:hypothetical protein
MSYLENLSPDTVLNAIGLQRQTESAILTETILPALAVFSAGLLVGAGIALLVTPKTGRQLRDDLSRKANELTDTVRSSLPMKTRDEKYETANPNPTL